jgi:hypothetical protein
MYACCNSCCWQRREHEAPSVHGELVVAAMECKVECDGPVPDWLRMEDVPANRVMGLKACVNQNPAGCRVFVGVPIPGLRKQAS